MGRALARVVATFRERDRRLSVVSMRALLVPPAFYANPLLRMHAIMRRRRNSLPTPACRHAGRPAACPVSGCRRDPSRGCAIGLWACRFGRQTAARQAAAAGSGACRWGRWPTIRRRRRWLYRTETSLRAGMMTSRSARRKLSPSPRQQTSAPPFGHKVHSHRIATRRTEPRHVPAAELGSASQVEKRSSARRATLASRTPSLSTCVMCASGWAPTPGAVVGATTTSARAATRPRVGWSTSRCVQLAPGYSADLLTTLTSHSGGTAGGGPVEQFAVCDCARCCCHCWHHCNAWA